MTRHRGLVVGSAVVLAAILLVAFNVLSHAVLRNARLDLTEDKLFTLSEGTKDVLGALDEPLSLRFYLTRDLANEFPSIRDYARRVEDLLAEYAAAAHGKITLEVINPEPFSDAEDDAVGFGLQGVPVDAAGDRLYFGLVGTNSTDQQSVIEFFRQEREPFLEYDLTRLVYEISTATKPVIGLISSLPLSGGPGNQQRGEPMFKPPWIVTKQIEQMFDLRRLEADGKPIDGDIDVLMLVHPRDLSPKALYAIDQFILAGGRALIFVDPFSEEGARNRDPRKPMDTQSSSLAELLKPWGVELVPGMVIADAQAARRVQTTEQGRPMVVPYLPWLSLGKQNFSQDEIITGELGSVNLASAGILRPLEESKIEFTPLIWSSPESMQLERFFVQFGGNPSELLKRFKPSGERYTIAARLHGKVASAFPDGPPADEEGGGSEASENETSGGGTPAEPPAGHLRESKGPIDVVIVADSDFLADSAWVQKQDFLGRSFAVPYADNGAFVANALEVLGGGSELIGLRSRGTGERRFEVVDALQRDAEMRFRETERGLQSRLDETEKKLAELRTSDNGSQAMLTKEQEATITEFRENLVAIRKQLRDVRHALRKDIDGLGTVLKVINIGAVPLLVGVIAIVVSLIRRRRRRRAIGLS